MTKSNDAIRPHSAEYFGAERDFFWNPDFLDLLAQRLDLQAVRSAADIGCGIGHWSVSLYSRLAPNADLFGVDREPSHVADYLARLQAVAADPARIRAMEGDAPNLPLPDHAFDMATCQTLLLHLENPEAAIREMIRITRRGGMVLCVEPNNLVGRMPFSGLMGEEPPERLIRLSEMAWRHALGRARLGRGAEFIGEQLPGMFAKLDLEDVRVWLSDKVSPSLPPYSSPDQIADLEAWKRWRTEGVGPYDRAEMQANVLAGGGSEEFFEQAWTDYLDRDREIAEATAAQRWHMAGGTLFYIVAGRVPRQVNCRKSQSPEKSAVPSLSRILGFSRKARICCPFRWIAHFAATGRPREIVEARRRHSYGVNAVGDSCLPQTRTLTKPDVKVGIGFARGEDAVDLGLFRMEDVTVQRRTLGFA